MEIRRDPTHGPKVLVRGGARDASIQRGIDEILITISHCRTYATATALALRTGGRPGRLVARLSRPGTRTSGRPGAARP